MFWRSFEVGDWVRTRRNVPVTIADHVTGGGVPKGSNGVVTEVRGGQVVVDVDAGWGTVTTTVRHSDLSLRRRGGGVEVFRRRSGRMATVRIAAALTLALPVLWYVAQYVWYYRTLDGITADFAVGVVEAGWAFLEGAIEHPVRALAFVAVSWLVGRLAFGRR